MQAMACKPSASTTYRAPGPHRLVAAPVASIVDHLRLPHQVIRSDAKWSVAEMGHSATHWPFSIVPGAPPGGPRKYILITGNSAPAGDVVHHCFGPLGPRILPLENATIFQHYLPRLLHFPVPHMSVTGYVTDTSDTPIHRCPARATPSRILAAQKALTGPCFCMPALPLMGWNARTRVSLVQAQRLPCHAKIFLASSPRCGGSEPLQGEHTGEVQARQHYADYTDKAWMST